MAQTATKVTTEVQVFDKQYINGEWVASTNGAKSLEVIDSNTAEVIATVPDGSAEDTNAAVAAARDAFPAWRDTPLSERKALIEKVAANYEKKKPQIVEALMKELGCTKDFAESTQANLFTWHAGTALAEVENIEWVTPQGAASVVQEPIGVVGAITPWNYPLNQIALKIIPAMLVGCTVVLKPSEVTPINAYLVAEAVHEAGLPKGVFNMVVGNGPECGEALSLHDDVDLISFTGSTRAGRRINEVASQTIKRVRTELGGKSAAMLLDDAEMETVIPEFIGQLMSNTGQSCNALSRMLVPESEYERAVAIAKAATEQFPPGRMGDADAKMGPLVSQIQWDRVQTLLKKGVEEGARVVTGGPGKPAGLEDGYFVKPTIFADVDNKMSIAQEEIFGPVLSVIPYKTEAEGIAIANDTIYGLNNAVGSADVQRALKVAGQLKSGTVMINGTAGSMTAAFGGYKQSGNAREWGKYGIEEFLQSKTINLPAAEVNKYMGAKL